jgi:Xaa-Pro aminopeptidase
MKKEGLDLLILTKPSNMFYLAGDGRLCAYALISKEGEVALGMPKTDIDDVKRSAHFNLVEGFEDEVGMIHSIAHFFTHFGVTEGTLGLEYTFLTHSMMHMLTHPHAKPERVQVKDCTGIMSALRIIKDDEEIERIRNAARVAVQGMKAAIASVRAGITESLVAAEAEYAMRKRGAEGFWRTYVSSGPRTNIAHGLPSLRKLEHGDLVMIDIHPIVEGYSADICRMVCAGSASAAARSAYDLYVKAQQETISAAKAGIEMAQLEHTLHGILKAAGHGGHVFGPPIHGVGIEFEEAPLPAGHAFFHGEKAPLPLQSNTVIAVGNCGLYTGPWGVRVEDTLVIGKEGPEVLTEHPRLLESAE